MSQVVLISGAPGSGKSAVAESLCERYDRTVHLDTDSFYRAIRMGHVKPWLEASKRQNETVSRAVARAATAYAADRYAVFIDGVIGPNLLDIYLQELPVGGVPVQYALLMPSVDECVRRAAGREPTERIREPQIRAVYDWLARHAEPGRFSIDNSNLTADQTADRIMEACAFGQCLVWAPPA
jgi:chloramphenicol 3-O-phosphotransferase